MSMKKDLRLSSIKVIGLILGFGLQLIFTKVIGMKEYGLYVLFASWTSFLSLILIMGYDKFIIKQLSFYYIQKQSGKFKTTLNKLLFYVTINSALFLLVAFLIPQHVLVNSFLPKELLRSSWLIIAGGTVVFTLFDLLGKVLSAVQKVGLSYMRSEIMYKCIWFIVVLGLFFFLRQSIGINIIIVGVIVAQVLTLLILLIFVDREKIQQFIALKKEDIVIGKENYVFFFTSLNYYIIAQVDKLVIGKYESLEMLGVYGLVVTLISIVSFSTIVYQRFLPKISSYIITDKIAELEQDFKTVSKNSLLIALPFIMFLIIFTDDVLLFFGERFTAGTPILRILIWGQLTNFLTGPNGNILVNGRHSKIDFINSIVIVLLTGAMIFFGYKYFGVLGIAAATSIGVMLINLVKVIEVRFFYKIFPYEWDNLFLIMLTFLAFYSVSRLHIGFDNLLLRLAANFALGLMTASVAIISFYYLKAGTRQRLKVGEVVK
ncbi:lipopolysaccharide biosynthesis protein [Pontibacter liquoris]|uniref:lipopolysaccharide biosynthesis protein n=1 Tax=Pontibacter liquoris TaxID=2905677 RepID=UPI001FA72969|nr:oligosaccharide flippase family protein [Pontibacter liquoris]